MQQSLARLGPLEAAVEGLSEAPAVALLGARQVGKTTLAAQVASAWNGRSTVFDLEVAATREALSATPERVLRECEGLVVLDEVQRMPGLFEVLRPICDAPDRKAVFLLLGSASWDLIKGISETLAGRILFVDVGGFSLAEVGPEEQDRLWMRGGFPRAYLARSSAAWTRWMGSFTRTFLERDVPGLGSRVSPAALGRFWRMLAHYHGQTWNAAELARSMDVSVTAVNHYRDLLAGTFMIRVCHRGSRIWASGSSNLPGSFCATAAFCISCWGSKTGTTCRSTRATAQAGRASPWSRRCWRTASATRSSTPPNAVRNWTCCSCGMDGAGVLSSNARTRRARRNPCTS